MTKKTYKGELFPTAPEEQEKPKRQTMTRHDKTICRLRGSGENIAYYLAKLHEETFEFYFATIKWEKETLRIARRFAPILYQIADHANDLAKWLNEGKWNPKPIEKLAAYFEAKNSAQILNAMRNDLLTVGARFNTLVGELLLNIRIALFRQCDDPREDFRERYEIGKGAERLSETASEWRATFAAYAEALERETK